MKPEHPQRPYSVPEFIGPGIDRAAYHRAMRAKLVNLATGVKLALDRGGWVDPDFMDDLAQACDEWNAERSQHGG